MAQNGDQWRALLDTAIKLKLHYYATHMLENKLVNEKRRVVDSFRGYSPFGVWYTGLHPVQMILPCITLISTTTFT